MATGLEWAWVGRSAGAGWFDSGDGHNSYCHSIGCRGHGVHDYNAVVVVEMAALTELAVIVLIVAMVPARLIAIGVGYQSLPW